MKESEIKIKSNFEVHDDENYAIISINPEIFEMVPIHLAAYSFLDKNHISIYGDAKNEIFIELRPKKSDIDLEDLCYAFNNYLIKCQFEFDKKENRVD